MGKTVDRPGADHLGYRRQPDLLHRLSKLSGWPSSFECRIDSSIGVGWVSLVGMPARQHVTDNDADGELVAPPVDHGFVVVELLWGGVEWRPGAIGQSGCCEGSLAKIAYEAKVHENWFGRAFPEHDVRRLDIAVDQLERVEVSHGVEQADGQIDHLWLRHGCRLQTIFERSNIEELFKHDVEDSLVRCLECQGVINFRYARRIAAFQCTDFTFGSNEVDLCAIHELEGDHSAVLVLSAKRFLESPLSAERNAAQSELSSHQFGNSRQLRSRVHFTAAGSGFNCASATLVSHGRSGAFLRGRIANLAPRPVNTRRPTPCRRKSSLALMARSAARFGKAT